MRGQNTIKGIILEKTTRDIYRWKNRLLCVLLIPVVVIASCLDILRGGALLILNDHGLSTVHIIQFHCEMWIWYGMGKLLAHSIL